MSTDNSPPPAADPPAQRKRDRVRWIVWSLVVPVVAVVLFDAWMTRTAEVTQEAWRQLMFRENHEGRKVRLSQLADSINGFPSRSEPRSATMYTYLAKQQVTYTWPGIFRRHEMHVFINPDHDPTVETIEGPPRAIDPALGRALERAVREVPEP